MSLAELSLEIRRCHACPLHKGRIQAVPGMGPPSADLFFLGEAPGEDEDRRGKPFVGRAGKLLSQFVTEAGLTKERLFVSNTVRCKPPNNRDPFDDEMAACSVWTEQQLELISPKLVVVLGRFAAAPYFPGLSVGEIRGSLTRKGNQLVFGSYHPAAALHQPQLRDQISKDFRMLGKVVNQL